MSGSLVDLASRVLGGVVVACNDQFYADASNLLLPHPARYDADAYDAKGKVYDGWETRRRRTPGPDWAVVRLGTPGIVAGFTRLGLAEPCRLAGIAERPE